MSLNSPKESAPNRSQGMLSQAAEFAKTARGQVFAGIGTLGLALSADIPSTQAQAPAPMVQPAAWNPETPEAKAEIQARKNDLRLVLQVQHKKEWEAYLVSRGNKPENMSDAQWTATRTDAARKIGRALNQYVTATPNTEPATHVAAAQMIVSISAADPELLLLALDTEGKALPQSKAEADKRVREIADAWNTVEPKLSEATLLRFALAYNHQADAFYAAGDMGAAYEASTKANGFLPQSKTPSKELDFMQKVLKRTSTLIAVRMENNAKQAQLAEAQTAFAKDPLNKAAAKIVYEDHVANKRYEAALRILCTLQFFGADVTADVPTEPAAQIDGAVKWEERLKDPKYQKDPVIRLLMHDAIERHYQAVLQNPKASAVLKSLAEKKLGQSAVPTAPVTPPKVTETKPVPVRPGPKETDPTKEPKRPNYVPKEAVWFYDEETGGGGWLLAIPKVIDYAEARKNAFSANAKLVSITNAKKRDAVMKISGGNQVFTGSSKINGTWRHPDGSECTFLDWNTNEPSSHDTEIYLLLTKQGKMNDFDPGNPLDKAIACYEWGPEKNVADIAKEPKRPNYIPKEAVWFAETKSWYLLIPRVMDLAEAEKMAAMTKGHLVTANNAAEYALIQKMAAGKPVFLGVRLNEGKWVNADGKADQYFDWQPGEPSNGRGETGVQMLGNGKSNDIHPLDPSCNSNVLLEWESEKKVVDLLSQLQEQKDLRGFIKSGEWNIKDDKIVVGKSTFAKLNTKLVMKGDYKISFEFTMLDGSEGPVIVLPIGENRELLYLFAGYEGKTSGIEEIGRIDARSNGYGLPSTTPKRGEKYMAELTVTKNVKTGKANLSITVNGRLLQTINNIDPEKASLPQQWGFDDEGSIQIGAYESSYSISKFQVENK